MLYFDMERTFKSSSYKSVVIENGVEVVNEEASRVWVNGKLVKDEKHDYVKGISSSPQKRLK